MFSLLRVDKLGPGYCHFPSSYDDECFEQLASEKVVTKYHRGFPRRVYVKVRPRNEMLDLRVYNRVALEMLNPNFERLKVRAKAASEQAAQAAPQQVPMASEHAQAQPAPFRHFPRPMPRRKNFVRGWK